MMESDKLKKKKPAKFENTMPPAALEMYMPLVHSIASMVSGKGLPPNVDYDDLVSDGTIGLMKAWGNFDSKRGVKFETYASYRVRGEILDGLKYYNPVPYRIQVMVRDIAKKGHSAIKGDQELTAKEQKMLEKKQLSEDEFKSAITKIKKIVSASALMYLLSLEDIEERTEVQVAGERTPADESEFSEMRARLADLISQLPPVDKDVLELFYKEEWTQKKIAAKLHLSRSKVNRILGRAIIKLKEKLK